MDNILEVSGLCKAYDHFALKDVTFTLPEDCITGFLGVNGAGKTTVIRSILGLIKRDAGTVRLFGKEFDGSCKELKDQIGVVFDDSYFYDELTIAEMTGVISPAYSQWNETAYRRYMEEFHLDPKQVIATLSKGMKMKYTLALSHNARLLIMDEPTSGLDPLIRRQLLSILTEYMKEGGRSIFFSTHITSDLDKIADLLILIDQGSILFKKDKDELLDEHRIIKGDVHTLNDNAKSLFYICTPPITDLQALPAAQRKSGS